MASDGPSAIELARLVADRAFACERAIHAVVSTADLTVEQWWVLHHLTEVDAASMSGLVTACRAPAPTMTRIVDKLVEHALVYRSLDGPDRRRVLVRLAPKGRALVASLTEPVETALGGPFDGLEPWQAGALEAVLRTTQ